MGHRDRRSAPTRLSLSFSLFLNTIFSTFCTSAAELPQSIAPLFQPPAHLQNQFSNYSSLLTFTNGARVQSPADWQKRREEIRTLWQNEIGQWPPLITKPRLEILNTTNRTSFTQHKVGVEVAPNFLLSGYLLIPSSP